MEPTLLGVQVSEALQTPEQASSEAAEEVQTLEAFLRTSQAYLWQQRLHLGVKEEHQLEGESGEVKEEAPPHPVSKLREQEEVPPLTILPDHKRIHRLEEEEGKVALHSKGICRVRLNNRCTVNLQELGNLKIKYAKLLISLSASNHRNRLKDLLATKLEMSLGL
jgi:hypothetical protein